MAKKEDTEVTKFFIFSKEDGWFTLSELEIPKETILKNAKLISKTEPDIFPIFVEHLIRAARKFYGI